MFSLTEYTIVLTSELFEGAVIRTFLAPASICNCAASVVKNLPVPSITMSTFKSFQGN
ncbi:Uncharacterised protein [Mycoplasmopsis arginini]|nr:Uncharacterised protein [Chlamydia abortus]SGA24001.1 Uncharacterised protein [Mycoplasmopsis arginini]SGA26704.1 Uncharacterised protein [Mycoplasmopsis arginini]SGA33141.1 Uncharacterised protein [Chlamydia abortus]